MTTTFQYQHGTMLLRYSGISFISGAVNHGFFSEERSLWTAAIGMVLFVLGAVLEHRIETNANDTPKKILLQTLALGSLLSIGLENGLENAASTAIASMHLGTWYLGRVPNRRHKGGP